MVNRRKRADDGAKGLQKNVRRVTLTLDQWYSKYTIQSTLAFVWKASRLYIPWYICWSLVYFWINWKMSKLAKKLTSDFTLKVLTFLVGILVSLTLKESLDRYRNCLGALVEFRDEFRSFWYFVQMQTHHCHTSRLIFDIHMVAFAVSVLGFILRKAGLDPSIAYSHVQEELRRCEVVSDQDDFYPRVLSNPVNAEAVLVSWLHCLGVMDRDMRLRWQWVRTKLLVVLTAQRVRSPYTSKHLLRVVLHVFLLVVPVCSEALSTKLATPVVAMLLCSLLQLAEELEDPFGDDEHDLPVEDIMSSITRIRLNPEIDHGYVPGVIDLLNNACETGMWDMEVAKRLFNSVEYEPDKPAVKYDTGKLYLTHYLTKPDIKRMDIIGNMDKHDPDVMLSTKL